MTNKSVELIFDLRCITETIDNEERVEKLWREINADLVGKPLVSGDVITLDVPAGTVNIWIANSNGIPQVMDDTEFQVVDVLRNPKLLYKCAVCGEYGPFRCVTCEEEGKETRLCSKHAHIIKDELSAYCPDHLPTCNCKNGCQEIATFRCDSCARTNRKHSLFGEHFHRHHPNDPDVDYCVRCYQLKFERCENPSCNRIGRSKCQYQTHSMAEPCNAPLCTDHSYQWKIWGPHNRGVTLCEKHQRTLGTTDPADLIFLIITAKPPFARRGRYHYMPNPFRLRRLINRHRRDPVSFSQLEYALKSLAPLVPDLGKRSERNYQRLVKSFEESIDNLDVLERDLLIQVRSYYSSSVGYYTAQQILSLEIQDRYYKPGQPPKYRVRIAVSGNKGRLIGSKGVYINALREKLNIEVDLD